MIRSTILATTLIITGLGCGSSLPAMEGKLTNLGPQITATTLIGTTFAKEPSGREIICTVMRGKPAKLLVYDLRSGELLHKLPLVGADGAWNATTSTDGIVYTGTDDNGHLYRYVPGEDKVTDLGQVPPDSWCWDECPGANGDVYVSTYPGCRIVRYRPGQGFKEVSNGPASPNENYARSVTFDKKTGKIYVGVGSHAHLVEIDPETGAKKEMLPKEYADQGWVYGVEVLGDRLFACVTDINKSIVFNLRTGKIETVLPHMQGQQVITKSPGDDRVWYTFNDELFCYDMSTPDKGPRDVMALRNAIGMGWTRWDEPEFPGDSLVIFTRYAQRIVYNPTTGKHVSASFKTPTEPIVIQSITLGPDGKIWTGGYLSGGNARLDITTDQHEELKGLSQAESMSSLGSSMYFGLYPGGRFATYDTSKPWDPKQNNPRQLGKLEGQSRPFGALGVKELNKVFWGTVPEYGTLGGGLAVYDPPTDKLSFHPQVVHNQSVIALAYSNGLIVGGTSIYGGLGIKPSEKEAHLFLWDPKANQKVFDDVPVPGAPAITNLIHGPDGKIWGIGDGTLFVFDVANRKIVSRHKLITVHYEKDKAVWRGGMIVLHPNGQIYGTWDKKFVQLDPATMKLTILRKEGENELIALDGDGKVYFKDKVDLWRYRP